NSLGVPPRDELLEADLLEPGIEASGESSAGGEVQVTERLDLHGSQLGSRADQLLEHRLTLRLEPAPEILVGRQPAYHLLHVPLRHRPHLQRLLLLPAPSQPRGPLSSGLQEAAG